MMSVYNGEKYIEAAVKSVLSQTYEDFEAIIVDDGSTDNSLNLLQSFVDERIRLICHSLRQGLTASLISAIRQAKGYFIARHDADDLSSPNRIEMQLAYLESNPDYVCCGTWYNVIDSRGQNKENEVRHPPIDYLAIMRYFGRGWNAICHGSALFRATTYTQSGGYNARWKYAQDFDLWVRMGKLGKIANLSQELYYWRDHNESISTAHLQDQLEAINRTLSEHLDLAKLPKNDYSSEYRSFLVCTAISVNKVLTYALHNQFNELETFLQRRKALYSYILEHDRFILNQTIEYITDCYESKGGSNSSLLELQLGRLGG